MFFCKKCINSCHAELFQLYFSSFEAGIANAISSFKWRKIFIFFENMHPLNLVIFLTERLPQTILSIFSDIIWFIICLKPYIPGRSRTRVNHCKMLAHVLSFQVQSQPALCFLTYTMIVHL